MKTKQFFIAFISLLLIGGFSLHGQEVTEKEKEREMERERKLREHQKEMVEAHERIEAAEQIRHIELEKMLEQQQEQLRKNQMIKEKLTKKELRELIEETKKIQEAEWMKLQEEQERNFERARRLYENNEDLRKSYWVQDSVKWSEFKFDTSKFTTNPFKHLQYYGGIEYDEFPEILINNNLSTAIKIPGHQESTTLVISKEVEDLDYSNDFTYDIPEGSRSVSIAVSGSLDKGTITITITKPDGTDLQEIEISPLANVNWNQTLRWKEENKDKFTGSWTVSIDADEATGHYKASMKNR